MLKRFSLHLLVIVGVVFVGLFFSYSNFRKNVSRLTTTPTPKQNTQEQNELNYDKTYQSNNLTLRYPARLILESQEEGVRLTHDVEYRHPDHCDFRGDGKYLEAIRDVDIRVMVFPKGLTETIKANEGDFISPYILPDGTIKTDGGFLDTYQDDNKVWDGYRITEGAEECGQYRYYFPVSSSQTLLIRRAFVPELSPNTLLSETYLKVPGVIPPTEEERLFQEILSSIEISL